MLNNTLANIVKNAPRISPVAFKVGAFSIFDFIDKAD